LYSRIILWNRLFTFLVVVGLMAAIRSLYDRLERSRENLRAMSRHLVSLQEIERRRLASELHDCAGQQLAGLGINLDIVRSELHGAGVADSVRTRLTYCKSCIDDMVDWMRGALDELRPSLLDSLGLVPALQKFARDLPRRTALQANVEVSGAPRPLPHDLELALFRVVQESLMNASRHSGADRAEVLLDYSAERLVVTVTDHGRGFDAEAEPRTGRRGFGLLIMNERATAAGASLRIDSAPGHGTHVTVAASIPRELPAARAA
jgi:signal transduction histidine kinase